MNKKCYIHDKIVLIIIFIICLFLISACQKFSLPELGNKYFLEHNYKEASKIYEEAIKEGYKTFDIFYNLGYIYYFENKDFKMAESIFKKGLLFYPTDSLLHWTLSQLYFEMGNLSDGLKEYKLAVKYETQIVRTIPADIVKETLIKQGKTNVEINTFFNEIIKVNHDDYYVLYELAKYNLKNKKYEEALKQYKRILELSPNATYVYREIGICYFNLEKYDLSFEYLQKAEKNGYMVPGDLMQKIAEFRGHDT